MKKYKFTYEKSGVNINAADNFVNFISNILPKNKNNKIFKNLFSKISQSTVLHIGGWKKLSDLSIDKQEFNKECAEFFNTNDDDINYKYK